MITSIFILIGSVILNIISILLGAFSYIIPSQITDAITYLFSTIHILDGVFPVDTLLLASTTILTVWGFIYLARIFLWFIAFIPGVGHHELPGIHKYDAGQDVGGGIKNIRRQLRSKSR